MFVELQTDLCFYAAAQLGAFDAVVKQMLEDVQERLVYRTHIYIQTDITGYNPAPGDLAYPEKLEMMEVGHFYLIFPQTKNPATVVCLASSQLALCRLM